MKEDEAMQADVGRSMSRPIGLRLLSVTGAALLLGSATATVWPVRSALALSEIQQQELPAFSETKDTDLSPPSVKIPMPEPLGPTSGDAEDGDEPELGRPDVDPDGPLPEIIYNLDRLPNPVRRMHNRLVEAARSGDIELLRPLIQPGDNGTQLSFGGIEDDPIAFLRSISGDEDGQEILAILQEVLEAGFVHLDPGTSHELYVWPYFFAMPLDRLDKRQRVELFKIVTAGDYEDMKQYGTYIFYRLGIDPDGRWIFFVAGD